MVTAQRLVRRLCVACRAPAPQSAAALRAAGFDEHQLDGWQPYAPTGCAACHGIGYRGRVGVHQVMPVSDAMRELIVASAGTHELARLAQTEQVATLARRGVGARARRHHQSRRSARRHRNRMSTGDDSSTAHCGRHALQMARRRRRRHPQKRHADRAGRAALREPCSSATSLFIVELTARGPAPRPTARAADVTLFTRQLASLLRAGLPLAPALDLLAQAQASSRQGMPRIVGALARDITAGLRFSAALQRHPAQFNALYCQLVEVGEAAGALAAVLARIADDRERAAAQRAKVRAALTYPVAILLLAMAITAALLVWVVPTFKQIFDGFGAKLPAPTQFVLALSSGAARWSIPAFAMIFAVDLGCDVSAAAFRSGAHPVRALIADECRSPVRCWARCARRAGAARSAPCYRPARRSPTRSIR